MESGIRRVAVDAIEDVCNYPFERLASIDTNIGKGTCFSLAERRLKFGEYDKPSVITPRRWMREIAPPNTGRISFTSIKLHIAISRALLSRNLTNLDLLFDAASSFLRYRNLIDSVSTNIKLNREMFEALRDFSQKARLGELAQGITMLFAQEFLSYPIFVDFQGFIKRRNSRANFTGLTPDYIIQKESDFNVGLIESKGHYSRNESTKSNLAKGVKQCSNGVSLVNTNIPAYAVQKSYCVCVNLSDETDLENSELQFIDPSEKVSNNDFNLELVQYHYASWFLLMGNLTLYDRLIRNELIAQEDLVGSLTGEYLGKSFILFEERDLILRIPYHLYSLTPHHIRRYGVLKQVIDMLMGKPLKLSQINFKPDVVADQNKGLTYFYDGTILMHRENPLW